MFFRRFTIVSYYVNLTKKCCIRECKENYNKENWRKVFRLPSNETEKKLWLSFFSKFYSLAGQRYAVICEVHCSKNTTLMSHRGKLCPVDPPCIFKVSVSSVNFAVSSKTKRPLPSVRSILQDELPAFKENDRFTSFNDLENNYCFILLPKLRIGQSCSRDVNENYCNWMRWGNRNSPLQFWCEWNSRTRLTIVDHDAGWKIWEHITSWKSIVNLSLKKQ